MTTRPPTPKIKAIVKKTVAAGAIVPARSSSKPRVSGMIEKLEVEPGQDREGAGDGRGDQRSCRTWSALNEAESSVVRRDQPGKRRRGGRPLRSLRGATAGRSGRISIQRELDFKLRQEELTRPKATCS